MQRLLCSFAIEICDLMASAGWHSGIAHWFCAPVVALALEGRLADQQLVQQHADAPPVHAEAGAAPLQHLRRLWERWKRSWSLLSKPVYQQQPLHTCRLAHEGPEFDCRMPGTSGICEIWYTSMLAAHLVLGRPADGVGPPLGDVLREAKVRDLDVAGGVHQQVLWLQVLQCQV